MSKYRQAGVQPPARCNGAPSLPLLPPSPSPSPSPSPGPSHLALVLRVLALIWRTRLPYTRCRPDRAHTLRARSAHAPHTRCTRVALTRWLAACAPPGAASRATHATHARPRGHQPATNQMYTRHCASASSTAALSLSRSLRLHCTRAAVWRREAGWLLLSSAERAAARPRLLSAARQTPTLPRERPVAALLRRHGEPCSVAGGQRRQGRVPSVRHRQPRRVVGASGARRGACVQSRGRG